LTETADLLIVRNDRLGDAILALPTIPILQKTYPDSRIHFWASPYVTPLIECVKGVGLVFSGSDKDGKHMLNELKRTQIGTAYCLRSTFSNAVTLKRAGIPKRVGTSRRWYSLLFTDRVNVKRHGINKHEADLNIDMIGVDSVIGATVFPEIIIPKDITLGKGGIYNTELLRTINRGSTNYEANLPLIVIHPGSGGSARDWPVQYFQQLADSLKQEINANIVVTGSKAEADICKIVTGEYHLNLSGKTDLIELAALLNRADLTISNSTGPLHLAVALGKKVLGIYPPVTDCLPSRWGPYGHPGWALIPEVSLCKKCRPGEFSSCACMESLSPELVLSKCLEILDE